MLVLTDSNNINFEVCHGVLSQSVYALLSLIQTMLNMSTSSTNDLGKSFWELAYGSVNQVLADHRPAVLYDVVHFWLLCKEYLTLVLKYCRLLFSAVIFEHFSNNRVIISLVAAKIWYLKNVQFFIGPPCNLVPAKGQWCSLAEKVNAGQAECNGSLPPSL